jgi:hypothetical protein
MFKRLLFVLALPWLALSARASNCEEIQSGIADRFRAGGIERFTLSTVDMDAAVPGRVVGRCDQGRKKIVFVQDGTPADGTASSAAPAPAPRAPAPRRQETITECRDGSVVVGSGDCKR